ncbi:DUF2279 domain-containing protein [Candidatus Marinimicrobia bacterium PRS2]|nr:DUF2279 domain-containing protein [Candidatus Marinimicrobia bacterium PRS2]
MYRILITILLTSSLFGKDFIAAFDVKQIMLYPKEEAKLTRRLTTKLIYLDKYQMVVKNNKPKILKEQSSNRYLDINEFTYAGHRKYTINGGTPLRKTDIDFKSGITTLSILAIGQHMMNKYVLEPSWWYGVDVPFHFQEDSNYSLYADRFGHAYSNYYLSTIISDGFMYAGLNWRDARLLGSLTSFLIFIQLEYKDGKAPDFGFSKMDIVANTIGILYFWGQNNSPFLQNFTPKIMYHYSKIFTHSRAYPAALAENYNEITYFLSVNIKNLLPNQYKKYWINGLEIAIGYGVRGYTLNKNDLHVGNNIPIHRRYYLGLDLNVLSILPEANNSWWWLVQTINHIKIPLPTIESSGQNKKAFLAYPY